MPTCLVALLSLLGGVAGSCDGSGGPRQNLIDKMANLNGEGSAGADYAKGALATTIYLFVEASKATETSDPGNDFGCKVAIHEYMHILQQGFLTGQLTSVTPSTDALGANRFQIENPGNLPAVFGTKVKAVLDALPSSLKLLTVPTYVILISQDGSTGVGSTAIATTAADAMMQIQFDVAGGCPGVDFNFRWQQWENNAMAEGEAEYFAENVYMDANSANLAWPTPYAGSAGWTNRIAEDTGLLSSLDKQKLHIGDGIGNTIETLEPHGWRANPVGELVFSYLKTVWRPATTHADVMNIWLATPGAGSYAAAFQTVMGNSWYKFVCDFETHHSIDATAACAAAASGASPPAADGGMGEFTGPLIGIILGSVAVVAIGGLGVRRYMCKPKAPGGQVQVTKTTNAQPAASPRDSPGEGADQA